MLSPEAIVEEFGEEWIRSDLRDVMPRPEVVPNGPLVELASIGVQKEHQGQGYASRALPTSRSKPAQRATSSFRGGLPTAWIPCIPRLYVAGAASCFARNLPARR